MRRLKERLLAGLLSFAMLFTMLPAVGLSASAAEDDTARNVQELYELAEESWGDGDMVNTKSFPIEAIKDESFPVTYFGMDAYPAEYSWEENATDEVALTFTVWSTDSEGLYRRMDGIGLYITPVFRDGGSNGRLIASSEQGEPALPCYCDVKKNGGTYTITVKENASSQDVLMSVEIYCKNGNITGAKLDQSINGKIPSGEFGWTKELYEMMDIMDGSCSYVNEDDTTLELVKVPFWDEFEEEESFYLDLQFTYADESTASFMESYWNAYKKTMKEMYGADVPDEAKNNTCSAFFGQEIQSMYPVQEGYVCKNSWMNMPYKSVFKTGTDGVVESITLENWGKFWNLFVGDVDLDISPVDGTYVRKPKKEEPKEEPKPEPDDETPDLAGQIAEQVGVVIGAAATVAVAVTAVAVLDSVISGTLPAALGWSTVSLGNVSLVSSHKKAITNATLTFTDPSTGKVVKQVTAQELSSAKLPVGNYEVSFTGVVDGKTTTATTQLDLSASSNLSKIQVSASSGTMKIS